MSAFASWVLTLLVSLDPHSRWRHTYERTATVIAETAVREPLFDGEDAEARTASLLVSIAWHESRFNPTARSKNGRWLCLYQVDRRFFADTSRALSDVPTCTRAAMRVLRRSLDLCRERPRHEQLGIYVSGRCDRGATESRIRLELAAELLEKHPPPAPDPRPPVCPYTIPPVCFSRRFVLHPFEAVVTSSLTTPRSDARVAEWQTQWV